MLRSLIADPIEVCIAGESALRSALSSCEADPSSKETEEGSVSTKQSDFLNAVHVPLATKHSDFPE